MTMSPPERRTPREFDHTHGPPQTSPLMTTPLEPALAAVNEQHGPNLQRLAENPRLQRVEPSGSSGPVTTGTALVLTRQDPWQVMDAWDDELVVRELNGEAPRGKLVYQFRQQGKDVVGLGKEGVDFACELLSHQGQVIRELDLTYELTGEGSEQEARFKAKAGRFAIGTNGELPLETVIAVKRQPLYNAVRSTGEMILNPHWFEQGAMKALRNARVRLLPLVLRERVMAMARADGRVQQDSGNRKTDEQREPASEEQRKLYAQMLASHHVTTEEREKGVTWLAGKRHSKLSLSNAIQALATLIETRQEAEQQVKGDARAEGEEGMGVGGSDYP